MMCHIFVFSSYWNLRRANYIQVKSYYYNAELVDTWCMLQWLCQEFVINSVEKVLRMLLGDSRSSNIAKATRTILNFDDH